MRASSIAKLRIETLEHEGPTGLPGTGTGTDTLLYQFGTKTAAARRYRYRGQGIAQLRIGVLCSTQMRGRFDRLPHRLGRYMADGIALQHMR